MGLKKNIINIKLIMFFSLLNLLGIGVVAKNVMLDKDDFTYRVRQYSHGEQEDAKVEETFVKSVINPVENYEGLSVESPEIESVVNTPTSENKVEEVKVEESPKEIYCAQDYDKILKPIQIELDESCYKDTEEELKQKVLENTEESDSEKSDSEESKTEESESEEEVDDIYIRRLYGDRCKKCRHFHKETSSDSEEEESRENFIYAILLDNKAIGYINDHNKLLEYLKEIKKRIRDRYIYDGTFEYWMRYYWNETIKFNWNNDLVVKYSLVSMNLHNLLTYDRLEITLTVHRLRNLLLK